MWHAQNGDADEGTEKEIEGRTRMVAVEEGEGSGELHSFVKHEQEVESEMSELSELAKAMPRR